MSLSELSLEKFRKDPLVAVSVDTLVLDARELTRLHGVHHLPVIRDGGLVGVVCTCDMLHEPPDTPIGALMHAPVSLSVRSTVHDALDAMAQHTVGSVIILDEQRPCGIVTRADLGSPFSKGPEDALQRCQKCGINAHLRSTKDGVFCVQCAARQESSPPLRFAFS